MDNLPKKEMRIDVLRIEHNSQSQTIFAIYAYPDCITSFCPHCGTKLKEPIY